MSGEWLMQFKDPQIIVFREGTRERLTVTKVNPPGEVTRWEISGPGSNSVLQVRTGNPPNAIAHALPWPSPAPQAALAPGRRRGRTPTPLTVSARTLDRVP